jgi:hypothetical protein
MIPPLPGSIFGGFFTLPLFRFTNSNHLWNVRPTSPLFTIVCNSLYSYVYDVSNLFIIISRFLTITHGQCSNFSISLPVSGLPFPLFAPCLSPCSVTWKLYKGRVGRFTIYQFIASATATIVAISALHCSPAQPPCADRRCA